MPQPDLPVTGFGELGVRLDFFTHEVQTLAPLILWQIFPRLGWDVFPFDALVHFGICLAKGRFVVTCHDGQIFKSMPLQKPLLKDRVTSAPLARMDCHSSPGFNPI